MPSPHRRRSRSRRPSSRDVKDRLIQTRVPERLESVLKEEAQKRRLTVSHLIRNMLEDTLNLVDTVVQGAGDIVGDSVDLAEQVVRDANKIAGTVGEAVRSRANARAEADAARSVITDTKSPKAEPATEAPAASAPERATRLAALEHVLAWNQVVVHKAARCASCDTELPRGSTAHLGLSQNPGAPPAWLCADCLAKL